MKHTHPSTWTEVQVYCRALGLSPGRMSHAQLAADLMVLTRLDEATLRKALGVVDTRHCERSEAIPIITPPTPTERARRRLCHLQARYERNMTLRDRQPKDSHQWHCNDVAARLCLRKVDEIEASLRGRNDRSNLDK